MSKKSLSRSARRIVKAVRRSETTETIDGMLRRMPLEQRRAVTAEIRAWAGEGLRQGDAMIREHGPVAELVRTRAQLAVALEGKETIG